MNAEKLHQVVELLAQVRMVLDGGWHYSSPILRGGLPPSMLVERSDALSMVAEVIKDLDAVSSTLFALSSRAEELEVDTKSMCGADLDLQGRVYQKLAQDISRAANEAVDSLTATEMKPQRRKSTRVPKSNGSSQTALVLENDTMPPSEPEVPQAEV